MTADRIYNEILMAEDDMVLRNLPTVNRKVCKECMSIGIRERKDQTFYCRDCSKPVETELVIYYYKNKTIDPVLAVERHRTFWNKIYYEQLFNEMYYSL